MESDPKQYWQYLNSLRNEENTNKNMDISTNFDELVKEFKYCQYCFGSDSIQ
jgi:hypothetical protein